MSMTAPQLFTLDDDPQLALRIAERISVELSPLELRHFSDTEFKIRPLASVRNRNVFVVASLAATQKHSINDVLCRILFFIACLKDHGAARIHLVIPYLGYARKDRRTKIMDPLTLRYVAQLLESSGSASIMSFDVHNEAAFINAFRCPTEHLDSIKLFTQQLAPLVAQRAVTLIAPDLGSIRRVQSLADALFTMHSTPCLFGFINKQRTQDIVTGDLMLGDVSGRTVVIFDDLISTGGTIVRAVQACRERGAAEIIVATTHALFGGVIPASILEAPIDHLLISNSLPWAPPSASLPGPHYQVVDSSPLFAHAIEVVHNGGSFATFSPHP